MDSSGAHTPQTALIFGGGWVYLVGFLILSLCLELISTGVSVCAGRVLYPFVFRHGGAESAPPHQVVSYDRSLQMLWR